MNYKIVKTFLWGVFIFIGLGALVMLSRQAFAVDANADVAVSPENAPQKLGKATAGVPSQGAAPFFFRKSEPSKWSDGWYEGAAGYETAMGEFQKTGKPMAVYMTVSWCPYCRRLEKEILSSPAVQEFLKDKIKVSINPESGRDENALAYRYGVSGFPSFFVHRPGSRKVMRLYTGETPQQFIEQFKYATE